MAGSPKRRALKNPDLAAEVNARRAAALSGTDLAAISLPHTLSLAERQRLVGSLRDGLLVYLAGKATNNATAPGVLPKSEWGNWSLYERIERHSAHLEEREANQAAIENTALGVTLRLVIPTEEPQPQAEA